MNFIELSAPEVGRVTPLVSVLMTTYNHQAYLSDAIEGVLSQRCDFPIELIIAEDCSTDGTRAIAERYLAGHPDKIRIITGETNLGLVANSNRALAQCRGEFVAFCEGDDWWCDPEKLQKQVALFANPRVGMVHSNFALARRVNGEWRISRSGALDDRPPEHLRGDLFEHTLWTQEPRLSTCVFRREVLEAFSKTILFNSHYVTNDYPMIVFTAASWRIEYCDEISTVYRYSPNSITRSGKWGAIRFVGGIAEIYLDIEKIYGDRPEYDARVQLSVLRQKAKASFRIEDQVEFHRTMRRIRKLDPRAASEPGLLARGLLLRVPWLGRLANWIIDAYRARSSLVSSGSS